MFVNIDGFWRVASRKFERNQPDTNPLPEMIISEWMVSISFLADILMLS